MKHIHFVIYRLKSIIIYCCYFILFFFINSFILFFCIYSEIEFIKPLDDVKIKRKTITFTKYRYPHTVFINKMINSGIMRMFIFGLLFTYSILLAKCYAFAQIIVVILVLKINSFFFLRIFFFFLFNNLVRNRHCI
jgi:hypothetical protein